MPRANPSSRPRFSSSACPTSELTPSPAFCANSNAAAAERTGTRNKARRGELSPARFLEFVLHGLARAQNRCVQLVVLTDLDRAMPPVRRSHQTQLSPLFRFAKVFLVVRRLESLFFREHP